jgi:hypothetical protein
LPAYPVTPLTVEFRPVVAESVTVFSPPVVRPTVLFVAPAAAVAPWPMTPGFLVGVVEGPFWAAVVGVGFVPSGFSLLGVFLRGVGFVPAPVVLLTVAVGFEAGVSAFLMLGPGVRALGRAFWVPRGVRVRVVVGREAWLMGVFFAAVGVEVEAPEVVTGVFFAGVVVELEGVAVDGVALFVADGKGFLTGVFAGVVVLLAAAVVVLLSFVGAFLTGATVFLEAEGVDAEGVVFLTGVAFEAVVVGLLALDFAPSATFERLATPA